MRFTTILFAIICIFVGFYLSENGAGADLQEEVDGAGSILILKNGTYTATEMVYLNDTITIVGFTEQVIIDAQVTLNADDINIRGVTFNQWVRFEEDAGIKNTNISNCIFNKGLNGNIAGDGFKNNTIYHCEFFDTVGVNYIYGTEYDKLDVRYCWWGHEDGPFYNAREINVRGSLYEPWLDEPLWDDYVSAKMEIKTLKEENKAIKKDLKDIEKEKDKLKDNNTALEDEVSNLETELALLEANMTVLEAKFAAWNTTLMNMNATLTDLNGDLTFLFNETEVQRPEMQISSEDEDFPFETSDILILVGIVCFTMVATIYIVSRM
jgi:FtsZ-binding cell division protein ZapB